MWNLQGDSLAGHQKCSSGHTPKGFEHGCGTARLVLKRLCYQAENRWEKGQEWMSSEKLEDSQESGEGDGNLDQGAIEGNTKKWTDLENQQNSITGWYGMQEREI